MCENNGIILWLWLSMLQYRRLKILQIFHYRSQLMCSHNMGNNWWPVPPLPGWVVSETNTTIIVIIHQNNHDHEYDHDDDEQVRAGAGVAAPPGAVSAGTGKGLVCRLLACLWSTSTSSSPLPLLRRLFPDNWLSIIINRKNSLKNTNFLQNPLSPNFEIW